MAIAFVDAATISSEDGVSFTTLKENENKEFVNATNRSAFEGSKLCLRDQLAENEAMRQELWKEQNNQFKPPPAMDEEEYQFLQEKEQIRNEENAKRKQFDREAEQEFEMLQMEKTVVVRQAQEIVPQDGSLFSFDASGGQEDGVTEDQDTTAVLQVKKRKKDKSKSKKKKGKDKKKRKKESADEQKAEGGGGEDKSSRGLGLLGQYSDSGSDS